MPRVYISANTQRAVIELAQGRCEYCQSRADYTTEPFAKVMLSHPVYWTVKLETWTKAAFALSLVGLNNLSEQTASGDCT